MMLQTIDQIPLWAVFLITTLILFTAAEIGFHLGKWRKRRSKDEEKGLLHEYVDVRLKGAQSVKSIDQLKQALARSEELHNELWTLSVSLAKENPTSIFVGLFVEALNEVIDLHSKRIAAGLRNRIPISIITTLYFVAILTMTLMGYQAGLTGIRTLVARFALILAFASVMLLITELDRPGKTMIKVSQQAMIDLQASMDKAKH